MAVTTLLSGTPAVLDSPKSGAAQFQAAPSQAIQAASPAMTETLNALKRGVDCYTGKRYASALEILPDEKAAKGSLLGDYVLLYRAKANLMMGQYTEALGGFRLLESRHADSPLLQDALTGQGEVLLKLKDPKAALAVLGSSRIELNSETLYLKAKAHREAGEREVAIELFLQVYSRYPSTKSSQLAEQDLLSLSPRELSGSRHYGLRLQRAENLLKAADTRKARSLLGTLGGVSAPDRASSEKRNLLLAEAEYRLGRTSTALTHLRKVTNDDSTLHARAIYLEGACYRKLKRETELLKLRDRALRIHPISPDTEELCYSAATYFELNYEPGKARDAYKILCQAFPRGRRAERARWQVAVFAYLAREYGEATLDSGTTCSHTRVPSQPVPRCTGWVAATKI
jgi:tetratricopeptide (TPR) repeat protein